MRTLSLISLGLALVGACRSDSKSPNVDGNNGSGSGSGNGDGNNVTVATTIQQVQDPNTAIGTPVNLTGVVVTAIDTYGNKTGDFWVEDPAGGAFSGVHVFGAPTSAVAALHVGDAVNISAAVKDEFAISSDTSGDTVTELKGAAGGMMMVTDTGAAPTKPQPQVVDALAIGMMSDATARRAEWEKWEGVLVSVSNVSALSTPKQINSMTPDATWKNFKITGDAQIESSLADFGTVKSGDCIANVTGVVDYAFDYQILNLAAVTGGGTGCPAPENASTCGDGIDNDGNGFADCADNGCVVASATCRMVTSISAVQAATPTGGVEIDGAVVTGIAHNGRSFWVATDGTAAVNQGLYVFNPNTLDAAITVGSKVNLIGKVSEFNDDMMGGTLTEFAPLSITPVAGTSPIVPIVGKTAAQLLDAGTAPMYESVLVTLTNVKITTLGSMTNGFVAQAVQSVGATNTTFSVGTDIVQLAAANQVCNATITGYWTNLEAGSSSATTKPNAFGFIPIAAGTTATGTCN